jgi:hypothetical protein
LKSNRARFRISSPILQSPTNDKARRTAPAKRYPWWQAAARKLVELAASIEPVQDGRIHIEKINAPFLYKLKGTGPEFGAGIAYTVEKG